MAAGRGHDLTMRAVEDQLRGMGAARYEIGLRHGATDRMLPRVWTTEEVVRAVDFLRGKNAEGHDIYVRPQGSVGLVLVDDLAPDRVAQLHRDGMTPAVVTETSPGNFQVWIRLSEQTLAPDLATQAARELAARYGGDPASADYRHYGRLAGFTNRKPERVRADGLPPYVLLHESTGQRAGRADEILDAAAARLRILEQQAEERERTAAEARLHTRTGGPADPARFPHPSGAALIGRLAEEYREQADRLIARYPNADMSRLDYTVLRELATRHPQATAHELSEALRQGSPNVHERKTNERWLDRYVEKTVTAVILDPHVREARREHDRQGGRRRGR